MDGAGDSNPVEARCEECGDVVLARGLCSKHYAKWRRDHGPRPDACCEVATCDLPVLAAGLCSTHYQRRRRRGAVNDDKPIRHKGVLMLCSIEGCGKVAARRGWCEGHYYRWKTYGDPNAGVRGPKAPNGSGSIDRNGYRVVTVGGRPRFEHRIVMEQTLGRPLRRDENVHHLNGVRSDNRPENLELWSTSQPQGQRVEDKVAWAIDFLSRYRPEALAVEHRL